ncbi:HAD-IA family hydrolase [Brachybacterium sp. YJGR34]|uniref:HAD-IA family hydrolase n=1 Tax=Brachybacterium sp. YJGR34 TaxID=2059911 RepID=UPI000E0C9CA2|nr:HAD-IA family hydrolase [Brachybacterium sp. YJGR34]
MRAMIWDLGGTLVDTYPDVDRALAGAIDPRPGPELLHEVALLTRVSSSRAIDTLASRHGVPAAHLRAAYEQTKELWTHRPPPVMAGARALLAAVRGADGLNLVATHRDRASALALIDALELPIDDLVCPGDGYARKPSPSMIRALLERHALNPEACFAVGDRPADVEAAVAAGVRAFLLHTPGVPLEAPGDLRTPSLDALIGLFTAREQS